MVNSHQPKEQEIWVEIKNTTPNAGESVSVGQWELVVEA